MVVSVLDRADAVCVPPALEYCTRPAPFGGTGSVTIASCPTRSSRVNEVETCCLRNVRVSSTTTPAIGIPPTMPPAAAASDGTSK